MQIGMGVIEIQLGLKAVKEFVHNPFVLSNKQLKSCIFLQSIGIE